MDVKKEPRKGFKAFTSLKNSALNISPTTLRYPLNFVVSFVLSRAIILGFSAPFGLATCAVLGAGSASILGLAGAVLGYLSILGSINSLKYIACMILIFTAHFVFSDTSLYRSRAFTPISVIVPSLCINLVFLADAGFPLFDCSLAVFEIGFAVVCTVLLSSLKKIDHFENARLSAGLLTLYAGICISLSKALLFGAVSVGHILAALLIILSAYTGGISAGAIIGTVLGFSISLAESSADFCMVYSILGISASLFMGKNKCLTLLAIPAAIFTALCLNRKLLIPITFELAIAAPCFLLLSNLFSKHARRFFVVPSSKRDSHIRAYASERLKLAANAFSSLGKLIGSTQGNNAPGVLSEKLLFEHASKETCKKCTLREICWKRDFESTRDALNNASVAIRKNGMLETSDFPIHFSSRCLHIESFTNTVNHEIFALRFRNRYNGRLNESKELLRNQYSDVANVFSALSSDLQDNAHFDEEAELKLSGIFASFGILCDIAVYRDSGNHLNIHLCGKDLGLIVREYKRFVPSIMSAVGVKISNPQYTHGESLDDIVIRELPPLRVVFGAAIKCKGGSEISGDSGSFFRPANGKLALLLSDGMGSGNLAARESAASVKLLEELLKSGISPQSALRTIHSALTLRAERTNSFSTLDLLYADLFTGCADIYKFGGSPTYIKRGKQIKRICASSLPAGMNIGTVAAPDKTSLKLSAGDFVIMTSDGTVDLNEDTEFIEFLSKSEETSPKALADSLLAYSLAVYGKNDDMTVAVIYIEREE